MDPDITLVTTITLGFVLACAGGMLANRLQLPPLVGYLLAGVVLGPFTPGFVGDANLASQLAEIGVILLMFGVGLHFSIKDLLAVRDIALPGAIAQMAVTTGSGIVIAVLWGWTIGAGLVLGLALSVASTVVLLRAMEQRNALDTVNGRIAVGWLIVEDLVTVVALVLLPALAGVLGGHASGAAPKLGSDNLGLTLFITVGKLVAFVALVYLIGTRAVPWLLQQVARTGSRELFTLAVLAIALGIAHGSAELFGVSFALGAFFAGVVLSESDFSHQAAADALPLQDAFAVLFFVSVGMLFDPQILVSQPLSVLSVVLLIVVGKSVAGFAIVIARGYPVATALTVSAGLAQIGEFSFILASLGVSLGLLPVEGRDLILAGAILSIMLNPLMFALVDPLADWLKSRPQWLRVLESGGGPAGLPESERARAFHGHAIIVGYGQVGEMIGAVLREEGLPFIVVELNRRRVEDLRRQGIVAVYGDATTPGILEAADIATAKLLILATPRGFQKRRIIELARSSNPHIDTAVRTHRASEVAYLKAQGVGVAIMETREVAFGLLSYGLASLGLSTDKVQSVVQKARSLGEGGAFEREIELPDPVPEIRDR